MAKKSTSKGYEFQLLNIELLEFNLIRPQKPLEVNQQVHFGLTIEQRIDEERELVYVACGISVFSDPEKNDCLATLTTSCNFQVKDLVQYKSEADERVVLPQGLLVLLNSISISTSRGILFSQLRGTHLHGVTLPIINPAGFSPTG